MTGEEFIAVLDRKGYSYETEGDKIIVTYGGSVYLSNLKTLPPGVEFKNKGDVYLNDLKTLPSGVEFGNNRNIYLNGLKTLPSGVEFKNGGWVDLENLEAIPPGVAFNNGGSVYLKGLGWVNDNEGIRIEGVENRKLLHLMIKQGVFI